MGLFVKEHVEFLSQESEIQTVDGKKGLQHMRLRIRVASYIPLSPRAATPIINMGDMMALLFARDVKYVYSCILSYTRDLEEVTAAVGKTLNSIISEFIPPDLKSSTKTSVARSHSPATHLVYRFLGLSKFSFTSIDIPANMAWLFLYFVSTHI